MQNRPPLTDGNSAYRVVRLLEAAQQSIAQNGREIELGKSALDEIRGAERLATLPR